MSAVEGTVELVRVERGRVLLAPEGSPMTEPPAVFADVYSRLYERLQRLGVPRLYGGYTVRVTHRMPAPFLEVARPPCEWEPASTGVTQAVMRWYVAAKLLQKQERSS